MDVRMALTLLFLTRWGFSVGIGEATCCFHPTGCIAQFPVFGHGFFVTFRVVVHLESSSHRKHSLSSILCFLGCCPPLCGESSNQLALAVNLLALGRGRQLRSAGREKAPPPTVRFLLPALLVVDHELHQTVLRQRHSRLLTACQRDSNKITPFPPTGPLGNRSLAAGSPLPLQSKFGPEQTPCLLQNGRLHCSTIL